MCSVCSVLHIYRVNKRNPLLCTLNTRWPETSDIDILQWASRVTYICIYICVLFCLLTFCFMRHLHNMFVPQSPGLTWKLFCILNLIRSHRRPFSTLQFQHQSALLFGVFIRDRTYNLLIHVMSTDCDRLRTKAKDTTNCTASFDAL